MNVEANEKDWLLFGETLARSAAAALEPGECRGAECIARRQRNGNAATRKNTAPARVGVGRRGNGSEATADVPAPRYPR
jgi:hypothetical protein